LFFGGTFIIFGVNGFLHVFETPPVPQQAGAFLGALSASGYMFPLIKLTQIVAGVLTLNKRTAPLGLVIIAPVLINIVAFHLFLDFSVGMVLPALLGMCAAYLARLYWAAFSPLWCAEMLQEDHRNKLPSPLDVISVEHAVKTEA